ncbi:Transient receptor potential cation channel trpm [Exaiptasia diaphana]|nr:Transient receptor potential cation channel trpm [Exaiptasia diaphana]
MNSRRNICKKLRNHNVFYTTECGCGLGKRAHSLLALRHIPSSEITWNPLVNTGTEPTDAYGQIEFSGAGQTSRAKDTVTYHMTSSMASSGACLDNNHTHFILVDNGSQGQYGVEIPFRASLENAISKRKMSSETKHGIPVVLLVLEGGPNTIRTVLESVTRSPAVPVVIAEGSGRAADILAFAHRFIVENEGPEITELQDLVEHRQLLQKIELAYPGESEESVLDIYKNVLKCVGNKRFVSITYKFNHTNYDLMACKALTYSF